MIITGYLSMKKSVSMKEDHFMENSMAEFIYDDRRGKLIS